MEAQHEYYAAHKLVITSALDAGVTDTMEKQPADPVLHLGKQLIASAEKAAGIRRLTLEEAEALLAAESTGREMRFSGFDKHSEGLVGLLGPPPRRDFYGAMQREHCTSSPMSTSDDVQVALNYSKEHKNRVIFKIVTHGFMEQGAPIRWLSAFPGESEYLYPPLTYLQPTGNVELVISSGVQYRVIEAVPNIAS